MITLYEAFITKGSLWPQTYQHIFLQLWMLFMIFVKSNTFLSVLVSKISVKKAFCVFSSVVFVNSQPDHLQQIVNKEMILSSKITSQKELCKGTYYMQQH